jgi:GH24 family phage-related lysozyme (muramidase)
MKASKNALKLIKRFEGVRLKSYKPVKTEKLYTIGYGHYGVAPNLTITQTEADKYLANDLVRVENLVNKYGSIYSFNQNEFDALVSFAFNIGSIKQLTADGTRSKSEIGKAMLLYTKSNGKTLKGLVGRRKAEHTLYCTPLVD